MVTNGKDASGAELTFGGTTKITADAWKKNSLNRNQKIGGVTGHELYHATKDMESRPAYPSSFHIDALPKL